MIDLIKQLSAHTHDADPKMAARARVGCTLLPAYYEAIENERAEKDSGPGLMAIGLSSVIACMVVDMATAQQADTGSMNEGKDIMKKLICLDIDILFGEYQIAKRNLK